ncbi:MAG: hypothetical protein SFW63_05615 [Alphaproteobacteria bacterium]|nr:hypothetical protein [Alphaproteobacteria bacterium]
MTTSAPKLSFASLAAMLLLLGTSACSPNVSGASASSLTVADAFEASSTMHFKPYTRSIFSTTDF